MMKTTVLILSCITMLASATAYVQAQGGTITADPAAQPLRPIWQVQGNEGDYVGMGIGGLGDIFGTGRGAWAVLYRAMAQWRVYRYDSGDISMDVIPVRTIDSASGPYPVVGDFWGTGHKAIGFQSGSLDTSTGRPKIYYEIHIYRTEGDSIADMAALVLNTRTMTLPRQVATGEVLAADLDGDRADELILVHAGVAPDSGATHHPEIWIYKGGVNFQVDSPTVIIKHPLENSLANVYAAAGDFDGDGLTDIVLSRGDNSLGKDHLTFYWGTGDLATFGKLENTRIIELGVGYPDAGLGITALDCDGDGTMDLAVDLTYAQPEGTYLFRSRGSRNARTRSFKINDADIAFPDRSSHTLAGHLNDSTRKYDILLLGGSPPAFFGGGMDGPDLAFDAYSNLAVFGVSTPLLDVDGDGWDDFLTANHSVNFNAGVATIFAGGPYIPGPKTSGVDAIAGEGHEQAVTIWPNPVHDELHIAWRGDLKRMPHAFVVHDALGREVTRGDVRAGAGAAAWHCTDVAEGTYLLSVYDSRGGLITTATVVKQ